MPNWKKVIVSGSDAVLNSVTTPAGTINTFTASFAVSTSLSDRSTRLDLVALNQTGASLAKGTVVRIPAVTNSSDTPRIVTASYESDATSAATLGITAETIAHGSTGYVITAGMLTGIDTSGWSTGTLLFLGTGGAITATPPTSPLHGVRLGQVVREQSTNGSIYVRVDNGAELGELHDVVDSNYGTTTNYGDLLVRSGSVWINSKQMTGSYGLTGSLAVNGPLYFASDAAGANGLSFVRNGSNVWTWGTSGIGNVMVISGNTTTLPQVVYTTNGLNVTPGGNSTSYGLIVTSGSYPAATIFRAGVSELVVTGSKVGMGTTTPAAKVHISGATGTALQIDRTGGVGSVYGTNSLIFETDTAFRFGQYAAKDLYINNQNGTSGTVFISSAGSLGVGTVTPGQKLDVVGSGQFSVQLIAGANTSATTEATLVLGAPPAGGAGEGGQLALQPATGYTSGSFIDNYQNKLRFLRGTATTSDAYKMQIDLQTGQLQIPNYTSTTSFTGTVAAALAVDSSGNVITTTAGGGGGGGTVTSVATAGTVSGITLTGGPITTTGTITLGGSISGLTTSNLSGTAGITNGQLANSAITIAGTSTSLGGSITAATILSGTGVVSGSSQINGASITNNTITIGTTAIALGSSATTIAGLSSVTSTTFVGSLTGTASGNLTSASTLTAGNLSGTIPSSVLGNSTVYIGTTATLLNRASANQALTGISSITFPGSTSGTATLQATATAGTPTLSLPTSTGTLIGTGDTGTVTNTMLAGSIANAKLTNSSITIAGNAISLGGSITAATILTSTGVFSGSAQITGLTNSNLSGTAGITNANLANSAITIAGTSVSLGGSIAQSTILAGSGVFSGSAQITGLTTSNLSGTAGITNGQLANSSITVGTTAISLGSSATTISGLSSTTTTNLTASLVSASSGVVAGGITVSGNTTLSGLIKMGGIPNTSKQHVLVYDTASAQVSYVTASVFGGGGGGGIGGSGITNYITKFTGTSTVGTSQLIDNGTNIGINNTTPQYKININQNGLSSDIISTDIVGGNNPFRIGHGYDNSSTTPANITSHIAFKPNTTWWGYGYYADDITFNVTGPTNTPANGDATGEIMRITADGLVGIKTSTPQADLDVVGIIGSSAGIYDTSGNDVGQLHFGHGIGYIGNYSQFNIQTPVVEGMSSNTDIANGVNWGDGYTGRAINNCTSNDNIQRGMLVYLENDGFWYRADAKGGNPRMATNLLGIALDSCSPYASFTVLLDGIIAMDKHTQLASPPKPGAPLYIETTNVGTRGYVTEIAPVLTGEYVRLIGQNISMTNNNTMIIKFQPDNTWIKL